MCMSVLPEENLTDFIWIEQYDQNKFREIKTIIISISILVQQEIPFLE
jgi:hypothetical protein